MRLLIIEDEQDIALPLQESLKSEGFAVDYAEDGSTGINLIRKNVYDCILLDLNLPRIDGITLAQRLQKGSNTTPIIMVTARSQIYNKIEGFKSGADDYITKPFHIQELIARIRAVIKRNSIVKTESLTCGPYTLFVDQNKLENHTVKEKNKRKIELSNKETGILEYLIRNKGKIISTEELLEHVWDREIDMFTDTVKTHIKTLRRKLRNKHIIRTVRGKGYVIDS
jgi:two-component system OmpR family response regulator